MGLLYRYNVSSYFVLLLVYFVPFCTFAVPEGLRYKLEPLKRELMALIYV